MTGRLRQECLEVLQKYTACDIADALLRLKVPGAGYIADLVQHCPAAEGKTTKTIATASTVLFLAKGQPVPENAPSKNIPANTHWADLAEPGTIAVLRQPEGQKNAVCGGIMALRMKVRGVKGIVVAGRARDLEELESTGLPIWARGLSAVGSGGSSTPWAVQVPIEIDGTHIHPGDLIFSDPASGVVVIPQDKVDKVVDLLPRLVSADEKVKEAVLGGMSVFDAFKAHRSNL